MVTEDNRQRVFRTQRLAMRCLTMDDAGLIFDQQDNLMVIKYLSPHVQNPQPWSIEEVRKGLETRIAKNHLHLLVYLLPEDQHMPTPAGSSPNDPNLEFPSISPDAIEGTPIGNAGMKSDYGIGYMIAYEHWGKGYATEAVAGILREFWRGVPEGRFGTVPKEEGDNDHKGKAYVKSMTYPENKASARVLEKAGGVDTGLIEMEDWSQKPEEKERDGVRKFKLQTYRMYEPDRHS